MLVDRHHVQYLIALGELAGDTPASQPQVHKDRLDAFLNTLGGAASPEAREAFAHRMQRLPAEDRPWAAVRRPDPATRLALGTAPVASGPPAALLVLGQGDDDSDGEEDGNRLPDPGTDAALHWARLQDALERWDTAEIRQWIGPLGWQRPHLNLQLDQEAEIVATPGLASAPGRPNKTTSFARSGAKERKS